MLGRRFAAISAVLITAVVILTAGVAVAQNEFGTVTGVPSWSPAINVSVGNLPKLSPAVLNYLHAHAGSTQPPTTPKVAPPPVAPAVAPGAPAVAPAAAPSLPDVSASAPLGLPVFTPSVAPAVAPSVALPSVIAPSVVAPAAAAGHNPAPAAAASAAPVAEPNPPAASDSGTIGAIGGLAATVPETARALITTPTGRSVAVVFALILAIFAFLAVHGRLDRRQLRLGTEQTARDLARFR
jgi:hypothetical protein